MPVKTTAQLANTMQSVSLLSHNVRVAKKKKVKTKDIIGMGVGNVAGTSMIKSTGNIIETL
jgi:hypothetical protein